MPAHAERATGRTVFVVDSSGSMVCSRVPEGTSPIDEVKQEFRREIAALNGAKSAVVLFGETLKTPCKVSVRRKMGHNSQASLDYVIDRIKAVGGTPLGQAIRIANEQFGDRCDVGDRIVVLTDGWETCEDDPLATVSTIRTGCQHRKIDVIAIGIDPRDLEKLKKISNMTGGTFKYSLAMSPDQWRVEGQSSTASAAGAENSGPSAQIGSDVQTIPDELSFGESEIPLEVSRSPAQKIEASLPTPELPDPAPVKSNQAPPGHPLVAPVPLL